MSAKRNIITIHCFFWLVHITLHWLRYYDSTPIWRLITGNIYYMSFIYIHYFFLIPLIVKKPNPKFITIWLIIFLVTHTMQGALYTFGMGYLEHQILSLDWMESIRYSILTTLYGAPLCLSTRLYYDWLTTTKINKELEIKAINNSLNKLKSEIDLPFAQRVIQALEKLSKSEPQAIQHQIIWFSNWLRFKLHHQKTTAAQVEFSVANDLICLLDTLFKFKIKIESEASKEEINAGIIISVIRYLFDQNLSHYVMTLTKNKELHIEGTDQKELSILKEDITSNHQLVTKSQDSTIIINLDQYEMPNSR